MRHLPSKTLSRLLSLPILGGGIGLLYAILIIFALSSPTADDALVNRLTNPPGMADRIIMLDSQSEWQRGQMSFVAVLQDENKFALLGGAPKAYPRVGTWTSPEFDLAFPSTEFIPCFNALLPPNTGLRFELRTRPRRADWSPWLYFGSWGRTPPATDRVTNFEDGEVYIDNLILKRPADLLQIRVQLFNYDMTDATPPNVRRIAVSYSGHAPEIAAADAAALKLNPADWCRDLKVPFRTQKDAPLPLRNQICSPTSTSMVMQYFGVDRPTIENALAMYDTEYDLFGNWARAVQRAAEFGLDSWLQRFRNWDQVKYQIAHGQPVIASIAFKKGQFNSAVITGTNGHLIVIRGFTKDGNVIVNDPASREKGEAAVYNADELANAWFAHGGVGYIIKGRKISPPTTFPTTQALK